MPPIITAMVYQVDISTIFVSKRWETCNFSSRRASQRLLSLSVPKRASLPPVSASAHAAAAGCRCSSTAHDGAITRVFSTQDSSELTKKPIASIAHRLHQAHQDPQANKAHRHKAASPTSPRFQSHGGEVHKFTAGAHSGEIYELHVSRRR